MHLSFLTGDEFWGSSVNDGLQETNVHHDVECKYIENIRGYTILLVVGGGEEGGVIVGGRNEYQYHIENVVQIFRIEMLDFKVLLGVKFQLVIRASSWLIRLERRYRSCVVRTITGSSPASTSANFYSVPYQFAILFRLLVL